MEKLVILLAIAICGASAFTPDASNATTRISNGNDAAFTQFPYSVSLQLTASSALLGRGHRCGGVLITYQHVLTAASCLYDNVGGTYVAINPQLYRIFSGSALLSEDADINRIRTIANFTVHPEYLHPPAYLNNIAVITLATPFLNTTVTPIALPVDDYEPADFTLCQIAGWGSQNATSTVSNILRYTTKYVYNQPLCTMLYSQLSSLPNIFDTMVCAASFDIVSSGCYGDEGLGLVCSGGLTGILFQTNVCAVSSYPEVYTRVSNYTTWIRSISGAAAFRPELTLFAILAVITAAFLNKA